MRQKILLGADYSYTVHVGYGIDEITKLKSTTKYRKPQIKVSISQGMPKKDQ